MKRVQPIALSRVSQTLEKEFISGSHRKVLLLIFSLWLRD